jgi:HEPN domain-containing protein
MNRSVEAGRWLTEAQEELRTAEWDLKGERYSAACFWAQQAVEKALKGFLTLHTDRALYEHSLVALVRAAAEHDASLGSLESTCALLDRYYIVTRYPNGLPTPAVPSQSFSAQEAAEAVAEGRALLEAIRERVATPT